MRHGMNPHQSAWAASTPGPLTVVHGEPSLINYLDALNAWQLVHESRAALGVPVAASFKHVSPAGVATAGDLDDTMRAAWDVADVRAGSLTSAYIRARDADPKSSFGDVVAVSEVVDHRLADFLTTVVADAVVAPGFEPGVVAKLAAKKQGRFLVLAADPSYLPPAWESRDVYGMRFHQERDVAPIHAALLEADGPLPTSVLRDALLSLMVLRYTQSNSVALVKDGIALAIGAGQQNRVDCVRLAAAKARVWWLRRHACVRQLPEVPGMRMNDRLNWQVRFADGAMTRRQAEEFCALFGPAARAASSATSWRDEWVGELQGLTLGSDGYLPFRDNVDFAAEVGVQTIVEPGGSVRTPEVKLAAREHGILHVETGLRLFHH